MDYAATGLDTMSTRHAGVRAPQPRQEHSYGNSGGRSYSYSNMIHNMSYSNGARKRWRGAYR